MLHKLASKKERELGYSAANKPYETSSANGARTTSDITAMIGTLFLFIMWPSFNAVMAGNGGRLRAISNTLASLCGCVLATFALSSLLKHKLDMVHVQNSTLAGGVALGSAGDLYTEPGGALAIGTCAGIISVLGYVYLTPWMQRNLGVLDTCGVHNLHGMPGVLAAIASAIVIAGTAGKNGMEFPLDNAKTQILVLLHTLGIAIASGVLTALVVHFGLPESSRIHSPQHFEDMMNWEVQSDYTSIGLSGEETPEKITQACSMAAIKVTMSNSQRYEPSIPAHRSGNRIVVQSSQHRITPHDNDANNDNMIEIASNLKVANLDRRGGGTQAGNDDDVRMRLSDIEKL
jgi:hypothetical protein